MVIDVVSMWSIFTSVFTFIIIKSYKLFKTDTIVFCTYFRICPIVNNFQITKVQPQGVS